MHIHEIKHIRLDFFTFHYPQKTNLWIKWLCCSRINNAPFDLFHEVLSSLQKLKNVTISAKKYKGNNN